MARAQFSDRSGPTQRQLRVGEVLRRALSEILSRGDLHDPELAGTSITVGEVRMSPDLKQAAVFVLPLGGKEAETVIEALNRNRGEVRRQVNRTVTLKFSPQFNFLVDKSFDQMDATRALLSDPRVQADIAAPSDPDTTED